MKKDKPINLKELRKLRNSFDITLEEVEVETGISLGYLSRIERGIVTDIENDAKRKRVENYILKLRKMKPNGRGKGKRGFGGYQK